MARTDQKTTDRPTKHPRHTKNQPKLSNELPKPARPWSANGQQFTKTSQALARAAQERAEAAAKSEAEAKALAEAQISDQNIRPAIQGLDVFSKLISGSKHRQAAPCPQ